MSFDLFLGVPEHRACGAVAASSMTEDGYVAVDPATLETRFPGVYAIGDVATTDVPKPVERAWRGRAAERGDPPGVPKRVGL